MGWKCLMNVIRVSDRHSIKMIETIKLHHGEIEAEKIKNLSR
jgi:hypothetical protein